MDTLELIMADWSHAFDLWQHSAQTTADFCAFLDAADHYQRELELMEAAIY